MEADDLILELQNQALTIHPEVSGIVTEAIGTEVLSERGIVPAAFAQCLGCFAFMLDQVPVDGVAVAAAVWSRVVEPLEELQGEFNSFSNATRLYTLLSPEEMMVDPDFVFRSDLPDVSNIHLATVVTDCSGGVDVQRAPVEITIQETGQVVALERDAMGRLEDDFLDQLPAALRIEQLAERRVVIDNRELIDEALEEMALGIPLDPLDPTQRERPGACGCSSTSTAATPALLFAALMLVAFRRRPQS